MRLRAVRLTHVRTQRHYRARTFSRDKGEGKSVLPTGDVPCRATTVGGHLPTATSHYPLLPLPPLAFLPFAEQSLLQGFALGLGQLAIDGRWDWRRTWGKTRPRARRPAGSPAADTPAAEWRAAGRSLASGCWSRNRPSPLVHRLLVLVRLLDLPRLGVRQEPFGVENDISGMKAHRGQEHQTGRPFRCPRETSLRRRPSRSESSRAGWPAPGRRQPPRPPGRRSKAGSAACPTAAASRPPRTRERRPPPTRGNRRANSGVPVQPIIMSRNALAETGRLIGGHQKPTAARPRARRGIALDSRRSGVGGRCRPAGPPPMRPAA